MDGNLEKFDENSENNENITHAVLNFLQEIDKKDFEKLLDIQNNLDEYMLESLNKLDMEFLHSLELSFNSWKEIIQKIFTIKDSLDNWDIEPEKVSHALRIFDLLWSNKNKQIEQYVRERTNYVEAYLDRGYADTLDIMRKEDIPLTEKDIDKNTGKILDTNSKQEFVDKFNQDIIQNLVLGNRKEFITLEEEKGKRKILLNNLLHESGEFFHLIEEIENSEEAYNRKFSLVSMSNGKVKDRFDFMEIDQKNVFVNDKQRRLIDFTTYEFAWATKEELRVLDNMVRNSDFEIRNETEWKNYGFVNDNKETIIRHIMRIMLMQSHCIENDKSLDDSYSFNDKYFENEEEYIEKVWYRYALGGWYTTIQSAKQSSWFLNRMRTMNPTNYTYKDYYEDLEDRVYSIVDNYIKKNQDKEGDFYSDFSHYIKKLNAGKLVEPGEFSGVYRIIEEAFKECYAYKRVLSVKKIEYNGAEIKELPMYEGQIDPLFLENVVQEFRIKEEFLKRNITNAIQNENFQLLSHFLPEYFDSYVDYENLSTQEEEGNIGKVCKFIVDGETYGVFMKNIEVDNYNFDRDNSELNDLVKYTITKQTKNSKGGGILLYEYDMLMVNDIYTRNSIIKIGKKHAMPYFKEGELLVEGYEYDKIDEDTILKELEQILKELDIDPIENIEDLLTGEIDSMMKKAIKRILIRLLYPDLSESEISKKEKDPMNEEIIANMILQNMWKNKTLRDALLRNKELKPKDETYQDNREFLYSIINQENYFAFFDYKDFMNSFFMGLNDTVQSFYRSSMQERFIAYRKEGYSIGESLEYTLHDILEIIAANMSNFMQERMITKDMKLEVHTINLAEFLGWEEQDGNK